MMHLFRIISCTVHVRYISVSNVADYLSYPRKDRKNAIMGVLGRYLTSNTFPNCAAFLTSILLTSVFYVLKKEDIFTIPNLLSTLRILATPVLGYLIVTEDYTSSIALFGFAGLTDMVRYNRTLINTIYFI